MDLNYLFYRQQIERSKADAASSEAVRQAHEDLAREYERKISEAAGRSGGDGRRTDADKSQVNPIMALAMTARDFGAR